MTSNQIIIMFHQDCMKFAMNLCKNYHEGNDLVQDAVVKLIEHEDELENLLPVQIKAWLFRTIKNKYIDDLRKNKRLIHEVAEKVVDDFQEGSILMMLENLNEYERKLIERRYIEGYSSSEIASEFKMNPSTIRNHLSSCLKKLRELYKEEL